MILFLPRTGSNYLASMLDTHPEILCHHELFLPTGVHRSLSVREGQLDLDLGEAAARDRDPYAFLRKVYSLHMGARAVGFKMSLADPQRGVLAALAGNRRIRKIVVRRDNWLQVYTSALIAQQTRQLIQFTDAAGDTSGNAATRVREGAGNVRPRDPAKVVVDLSEFRRYVRKRLRAYAVLRAFFSVTRQPAMEIEYNEIKDAARMRDVLRFLRVSPDAPLRERTTKQNPSRLSDRIENWPAVKGSLEGTRFAHFIRDE